MARLFGMRWQVGDVAATRAAAAIGETFAAPWRRVIARRGVLLWATQDGAQTPAIELPHEGGMLVGQTFERADGVSRPLMGEAIDARRCEAWVTRRGEAFVRECWGPNLAIFHDSFADNLTIIRDAGGGRPLYIDARANPILFFTHVDDWLTHAKSVELDCDYLAAFVAQSRIVTSQTGLQGVEELLPGERVVLGRRGLSWDMVWRPPMRGAAPMSFDQARSALRAAVFDAGQAWRRASGAFVHRLSGGLDSSIVLAALHQGEGGAIVCVNERAENLPEADEFALAAQTAAYWGVPIEAWTSIPQHVDYAALLEIETHGKPSLADMGFADPVARALAKRAAGAVVSSGQGGDQIFQRGRAPFLVADALRDGLSPKAIMRVARDAARLSKTHMWDVLGEGVKHGLFRAPFDPIGRERFATPLASSGGMDHANALRQAHAWLLGAKTLPPARRWRLTRAVDLAFYAQPSVLTTASTSAAVLASRPVMECAYAIAPYVMVEGGVDRALARSAFGDCVPAAVLARTRKGDTTRFHTAVLERNFPFMREMLIGGRLVQHGLVDANALEKALSRAWAPDGLLNANLTTCLLAETWIRRLEAAQARTRQSPAARAS